jgi:hypothetical protein
MVPDGNGGWRDRWRTIGLFWSASSESEDKKSSKNRFTPFGGGFL